MEIITSQHSDVLAVKTKSGPEVKFKDLHNLPTREPREEEIAIIHSIDKQFNNKPTVAKDVLAARWQTWISIICQTFGLSVLFICVKFGDGDFVSRSDDTWYCLEAFWWG
jgi:hypothetical protein